MIPITLPKEFDLTAYEEGEPFDVTATFVLKEGKPMLKAVNDLELGEAEMEEEDGEEESYEMDEEALQTAAGGGMM